jgi:hypothetical protein
MDVFKGIAALDSHTKFKRCVPAGYARGLHHTAEPKPPKISGTSPKYSKQEFVPARGLWETVCLSYAISKILFCLYETTSRHPAP